MSDFAALSEDVKRWQFQLQDESDQHGSFYRLEDKNQYRSDLSFQGTSLEEVATYIKGIRAGLLGQKACLRTP